MDFLTSQLTIDHAKKARETGFFAYLAKDGPASGLADLGALLVTGADAGTFLHSQLTNEVNALKPGEGNLSARVTRTGNLVQYFSLHRLPQSDSVPPRFMLILERSGIPSLQSDLEKFAIADDVAFENVSQNFEFLAVQGPHAAAAIESAFGKLTGESWSDLAEYSVREVNGALIFSRSLTGDSGFIVATSPAKAELTGMSALLQLRGQELAATLEILRIEAGILRVGPDAAEGKLVLPETCLEQQVVSYSKGCYLGQEVIARIRTYGSVPMALRGLVFEECGKDFAGWSAALENMPDVGADLLLDDGKKVGTIASRAISPVYEAPLAFAYLDRTNRTPGTKLKLKGKNGTLLARVALLPFYKASDVKSRVTFLHDRAIRLFADQQDEKAIDFLNQALRLDPSFADGYEALGVILGRTGRFHEAIDIFKRLEEVAPNEPMVHSNLSLFYMKLGDKQAAEDEKAKATVKQFSRFGAMKKEEERVAEAAAHAEADALRRKAMFEEVLQIDPEDPIALFGLGNALSALRDWAAAEKVLAKSSEVQKDNSAVYVAHGKALEMLNREADALEVYRAGMAVASRKGDLMPLKEMERRVLLLSPAPASPTAGKK